MVGLKKKQESQVSNLQEQIDKVEQIVDRTALRMFVVGVVGGVFFGTLSTFGQVWAVVGFAILGGCIGFCSFSVRKSREEYRKLLEQLNS